MPDFSRPSTSLRRLLLVFLAACLIAPTFQVAADGKFYAPIAIASNVSIPDQRALICYTNGIERLAIETRFTGAGTNFAWVIPLGSLGEPPARRSDS